ncbi:flippase-like domain-containing protein [Pandoraea nosoerga]|uniref:Membrane protein n=1 Tax=Pandoraea nosoerga TaxID=2508296 RepID=A0A5E4W046_9BURK|nr:MULTISPECIES: flippase-like domain-containing protein [Pandoraea]MBN4666218.1 flippase-like domain-containing protein [Pandoraea nosoerga]MBN4676273.1 flippase-like domain-containing protein [Pandoraea nosoerga]MBN4681310.1 flippase-like domain-containing protein [Pandoraea nosoerga]MBN4745385.1 flippase-like domain-containing protein [Pandoraea nosoerga]VVE16924.1 membrane protein [Pandoraea nosoerga]
MNRTAIVSLTLGLALFVALLIWQGAGSVMSTLAMAGWGLLPIAAFHLVPLALDAAAIQVLVARSCSLRRAVLTRWVGESVNSLLPAGQIGGPIAMVRQMKQRGLAGREAAAAITVSTTLQAVAQIVFALLGLAVFGISATRDTAAGLWLPMLLATGVISALLYVFYVAQRRGIFGWALRMLSKMSSKRDWSSLLDRADAVDEIVQRMYGERRQLFASFVLSLLGWIVGTAEVWLVLQFIGHPVSWVDALLLESLGQAIRGAAFFVPGSLGVQEGGYLLLASLVGLPADAALALSLAKRTRELLLGVPGLVYLHYSERGWRRRRAAQQSVPLPAATDTAPL